MNIAIVARSQGEAQDIIKFYGIDRRKDNVTVFTVPEQLQGCSFSGRLLITATETVLIPNRPELGRIYRYKMMEFLK